MEQKRNKGMNQCGGKVDTDGPEATDERGYKKYKRVRAVRRRVERCAVVERN
jgi:hypothetical protein